MEWISEASTLALQLGVAGITVIVTLGLVIYFTKEMAKQREAHRQDLKAKDAQLQANTEKMLTVLQEQTVVFTDLKNTVGNTNVIMERFMTTFRN